MSGRGNKGKGHAFPGDFIALGSKSGSSKASAPPPSNAHTAHAQPVKKMKGAEARTGLKTGERQGHTWENIAEEVTRVSTDPGPQGGGDHLKRSTSMHGHKNGKLYRVSQKICNFDF